MGTSGFSERALAFVEDVVAAAADHQPADVRHRLDAAVKILGAGPCIDSVLMPAIRRIARLREPDVRAAGVVLAVESARAWLELLTACTPPPLARPCLVLACGPGDQHSLGLEALAVLLRFQRQPCRVLGARVNARKLSTAVAANRASGVVLVAHRDAGRRACVDLLAAMTGNGTTAFYAGAAFDTARARHDVAGSYLGTSFQRACTTILRSVDAEQHRGAPEPE